MCVNDMNWLKRMFMQNEEIYELKREIILLKAEMRNLQHIIQNIIRVHNLQTL